MSIKRMCGFINLPKLLGVCIFLSLCVKTVLIMILNRVLCIWPMELERCGPSSQMKHTTKLHYGTLGSSASGALVPKTPKGGFLLSSVQMWTLVLTLVTQKYEFLAAPDFGFTFFLAEVQTSLAL